MAFPFDSSTPFCMSFTVSKSSHIVKVAITGLAAGTYAGGLVAAWQTRASDLPGSFRHNINKPTIPSTDNGSTSLSHTHPTTTHLSSKLHDLKLPIFLTETATMTADKPTPTHVRVDAKLLIPGRGDPIKNASLISKNNEIIYVGPTSDLSNEHASIPAISVPILMPGLWDCHVHLVGTEKYALDTWAATPLALAGARSARDVVALLNAGYTSVRELAGYGTELAKAIEEGWLPGPNIYSSVSILSQTAGHGDARSIPLGILQDKISHGLPLCICDGEEECIKAVRRMIRKGAKVIKIAASGGVASICDDIHSQQFSLEEMKVIVAEAERQGLIVAAHCHGIAGIEAALKSGCKTIEHGTFLTQEMVDFMVKNDIMLIPTRSTLEFALRHPESWDKEMYDEIVKLNNSHKISYRMALKAGVKIAMGSDLGVSSMKVPWNHGMNGDELRCAVEMGMTELQAIEAATAIAPETLGPQAPKSGQLKVGYDADFIAVAENPLEDIEVLKQPSKITHVWKGGKLFKADSKPISFLD